MVCSCAEPPKAIKHDQVLSASRLARIAVNPAQDPYYGRTLPTDWTTVLLLPALFSFKQQPGPIGDYYLDSLLCATK